MKIAVGAFSRRELKKSLKFSLSSDSIFRVIQGSFANCNISLGLDLFNEGITEYI